MTDSTPDSTPEPGKPRRRRLLPAVWVAGVAAAGILAFAVTGTLSGFTASIKNDTNTTGSGTLLMQESNGAGTVNCYSNGTATGAVDANNKSTCSIINKLGGDQTGGLNLAPGATGTSTTVKIKNAGTIAASQFTLTPDTTCTQSNNTGNTGVIAYGTANDFCSKINITITKDGTTVFQGTAAQLASGTGATTPLPANLGATAAGATATMVFTVGLDSSAGNNYQGLALSLPLTWQFTQ